ncbi:MAG: hypothetical protein ACLTJG_02460 [[Clostridium] innocuum]
MTYASRCIENEILMFLRKKSRRKVEVSFDEPLNIDYDGNELLLSDILGTDDDVVTKEFEKENKRGAAGGDVDAEGRNARYAMRCTAFSMKG